MEGGGALGTLARLTLAGSVSSNKRSSLGRSLTPASLHNLNGSVVSCNTSGLYNSGYFTLLNVLSLSSGSSIPVSMNSN